MAFGEGFKHMDTFEQLEDGNYRAKIIKAEIKNGNYGDYIQAEVEIEGHPKAVLDHLQKNRPLRCGTELCLSSLLHSELPKEILSQLIGLVRWETLP